MLQEVEAFDPIEDPLPKTSTALKTPKARRKKAPPKAPKAPLILPILDFPDLPGASSKAPPIPLIQPSPKKPTRRQAAKRVVEVPEEIFEPPATVSRHGRICRSRVPNGWMGLWISI